MITHITMSIEISDVVNEVTKMKAEELRRMFVDTLDKPNSRSVIVLTYNEHVGGGEETRVVVGVPYEISDNHLVLGPYVKGAINSAPDDYDERKKRIPVSMIVAFRRRNSPKSQK